WPRDPWAISREPGLPDADNFPTRAPAAGGSPRKMKNMPPKPEDATNGARMLRRTARGKSRADLIDHVFHYGEPGDMPVAGDWNGDGVDKVGVYRGGKWILDTNNNHRIDAQDKVFELGGAGDKPVVGDWNDDGTDDPGVFHPTAPADRVTRKA